MAYLKLLCIWIGTWTLTPASEAKSLFLIHSYAPNSWTARFDEGFDREASARGYSVERYYYHSEYWENADPAERAREIETILKRAVEKGVDGYIVVDDEAANRMAPGILSSGKPAVFTGINRRRDDPTLTPFCTRRTRAILEDYPYAPALHRILKKRPNARHYAVIASTSTTANELIAGLASTTASEFPGLKPLQVIQSTSWEHWKAELMRLDAGIDFIWIFVPYGIRDRMNEEISPARMGAWIRANLKTTKVGAHILSEDLDLNVGFKPADLARESLKAFLELSRGSQGHCPESSRSYRINDRIRPTGRNRG